MLFSCLTAEHWWQTHKLLSSICLSLWEERHTTNSLNSDRVCVCDSRSSKKMEKHSLFNLTWIRAHVNSFSRLLLRTPAKWLNRNAIQCFFCKNSITAPVSTLIRITSALQLLWRVKLTETERGSADGSLRLITAGSREQGIVGNVLHWTHVKGPSRHKQNKWKVNETGRARWV